MASWYGYTGPEPPSEYLEEAIFPILLPGLEELLRAAKKSERRRRFNSLDYLVEYLYNHNPHHPLRDKLLLEDIPFVKEEWAENPRPVLPLSATMTEDEAATVIQSFYRGYLVRREQKPQLFRTWQRKVWEERKAASKIKNFLKKVSTTRNPHMELLTERREEIRNTPHPQNEPLQELVSQEELDNSVEETDNE